MTTTMPGQPWDGAARSAIWPAAASGSSGGGRPGCTAARTAMAATATADHQHEPQQRPWSLSLEEEGCGSSSADPHPAEAEVASAASAFSACRHQHHQLHQQASQHQPAPALAATTCSAFSRVPGRKRPRPPSASPSPAAHHHQCPSPASSTGGTTTASDAEGEAPARTAHHMHPTVRNRQMQMQVWRSGPTPPEKQVQQLSPLTDSSGQSTPPSLLGEEEGGRSPTPMGGHAPPAPEGRAVSSSGGETDGEGMEVDAQAQQPLPQPQLQLHEQQPGAPAAEAGEAAQEEEQAEDDWDAAARWLGAIGVVELPAEAGPRIAAAAEGGATDADGRVDEEAVCAGWAWAEACGATNGEGGQGFDWEADPAFRPWSSQSTAAAATTTVKGVGLLGLASAGADGGSAFTRLAPRAVVLAAAGGAGGAAPAPVAEWDWPHRQHPLQRTVDSDASGASSAVSMDLGHDGKVEVEEEDDDEDEEEEAEQQQRRRQLAHSGSPVPLPPAPAILDEAAVQVDPKVRHVCLARRTLGDREIRVLFGPKGFPDFLGMGPLAVVPTYQALIQEHGRPLL